MNFDVLEAQIEQASASPALIQAPSPPTVQQQDNGGNHIHPPVRGCDDSAYEWGWLPVFQQCTGVLFDGQTEYDVFMRLLGGEEILQLMADERTDKQNKVFKTQDSKTIHCIHLQGSEKNRTYPVCGVA